MGKPTADDPLGTKPDPASFSEMLEAVVDARIEQRLRGRSSSRFNDVPDTHLVHELIARGWAVFRPRTND